jgi:hypothetical protein
MGNFAKEPNLVKVTRLRKGPGDSNPKEHFVGHLVDEYGNDLETPEIGQPICLTGEEAGDHPYLFKTDPIWRMHVFATYWLVMTESGTQYEIKSEDRLVQ